MCGIPDSFLLVSLWDLPEFYFNFFTILVSSNLFLSQNFYGGGDII
jgi:hypothetical protein